MYINEQTNNKKHTKMKKNQFIRLYLLFVNEYMTSNLNVEHFANEQLLTIKDADRVIKIGRRLFAWEKIKENVNKPVYNAYA